MNLIKSIYLDYAATSPVREEVLEVMLPFFTNHYGNAGNLHDMGRNSYETIEIARKQVANSLSAKSAREIVFTSSGTEANNLALFGVALKQANRGKHIITTQIEHPSVLKACQALEKKGYWVTYLSVNKEGIICLEELKKTITDQTILVSIMAANNEVGSIQPLSDVAAITSEKGILLHTDAVQYFGKIPFTVEDLGVDLLSIGSHKIYGPKGAGALYIKQGVQLEPIMYGGDQERALRPSTPNTPAIVGFGLASKLASEGASEYKNKVTKLRDYCWGRIQGEIGNVTLNGHPSQRLPNNLNLSFYNIEGQALMLELNRSQIFTSSGSACSAGMHQASHVLMAMTQNEDIAVQSLRITLGKETTKEEIDIFIDELKRAVHYWQALCQ